MTIVVNFVAGCGAGKSLMTALTFSELKMMHLNVELVQEYAKQLVWQNRLDELDNQFSVTKNQYNMIKALQDKVDYIVCDSPLIVGLFYNFYSKTNVSNVEKTRDMILNKMKEFHNVYIFLERNPEYPFSQEGRLQTEIQAKEIDKQMKDLLHEYNIDYLSIISSKDSIKEIVEYIFSKKNEF